MPLFGVFLFSVSPLQDDVAHALGQFLEIFASRHVQSPLKRRLVLAGEFGFSGGLVWQIFIHRHVEYSVGWFVYHCLGGGCFKYVFLRPYLGKIPILTSIFFK